VGNGSDEGEVSPGQPSYVGSPPRGYRQNWGESIHKTQNSDPAFAVLGALGSEFQSEARAEDRPLREVHGAANGTIGAAVSRSIARRSSGPPPPAFPLKSGPSPRSGLRTLVLTSHSAAAGARLPFLRETCRRSGAVRWKGVASETIHCVRGCRGNRLDCLHGHRNNPSGSTPTKARDGALQGVPVPERNMASASGESVRRFLDVLRVQRHRCYGRVRNRCSPESDGIGHDCSDHLEHGWNNHHFPGPTGTERERHKGLCSPNNWVQVPPNRRGCFRLDRSDKAAKFREPDVRIQVL
jgi:hypothetical protein